MIDAALLMKQQASVCGVVAYEAIVRPAGIAELLVRPTQNATVPVAGNGVAVIEAGRVAQNTSLAIADRGYFHFLSPLVVGASFSNNLQSDYVFCGI